LASASLDSLDSWSELLRNSIIKEATFGAPVARAELPVIYNFPVALAIGLAAPEASPPGANDFSCKPTSAHPLPVVLVHGTFNDMADSWNALSPLLKNEGYCVFALNYGDSGVHLNPIKATGSIATSAEELATFVSGVLAATGASKVDIVGYSQGGMMPRQYLKFDGGAEKVHSLVALAPSNHGTTLSGLGTLAEAIPGAIELIGSACQACTDQLVGSPFITNLNAGGDTLPGIKYTVISTRYDEVVTPYTSQFLSGPEVTNITLQNQCILDLGDHLSMPYDSIALHDVSNALDPAHATPPACVPVIAGIGG
jgi:triacylglycerol esterase/lipase EstA (alpha/beta hydrolase family)